MQSDPIAEPVASQVRAVLGELHVSGSELARKCEWTQSYVSRRMSGATPWSGPDLLAIARALNISPRRLLPNVAEVNRS